MRQKESATYLTLSLLTLNYLILSSSVSTSPTTEEIYREGTTNFKVICHEWNKNNPDKTIDINTTQPNYRDLK